MTSPPLPRSEDLAARVQAGDTEAAEVLLRRFTPLVFRLAAKVRVPGYEREDVLVTARLGVVEAMRTYRPDRGASFWTHTRRCVWSDLLNALVVARRLYRRVRLDTEGPNRAGATLDELAERLERTGDAEAVELLDALRAGGSVVATARRLGMTERGARRAWHRILAKARDEMGGTSWGRNRRVA